MIQGITMKLVARAIPGCPLKPIRISVCTEPSPIKILPMPWWRLAVQVAGEVERLTRPG